MELVGIRLLLAKLFDDFGFSVIKDNRAVAFGLKDFKWLKEHDALAYFRIQPDFENFEQNGFQSTKPASSGSDSSGSSPSAGGDLPEQLRCHEDLRERGLLSEDEFMVQQQKLRGS